MKLNTVVEVNLTNTCKLKKILYEKFCFIKTKIQKVKVFYLN